MAKYPKCERCPDEDTNKCTSCNQDRLPDPVEITIEKAIKYFTEENKNYENVLGKRAEIITEYRMNLLAIDALRMFISQA